MFGFVAGLARASWFPYVMLGAIALGSAIWGHGRITGYSSGQADTMVAMNSALVAQYQRMTALIINEGTQALEAEREKNAINHQIMAVPANSCVVSDECVQFYDNVLRASTTTLP